MIGQSDKKRKMSYRLGSGSVGYSELWGFIIIQFTVMISLAVEVRSGEWSRWLGDNGRSQAFETEKELNLKDEPLRKAWSMPIGGGYAGPAISGGQVVVMDWKMDDPSKAGDNPFERGVLPGRESIISFDLKSGEKHWSFPYREEYTISYPAGPRTTCLISDGMVFGLGAEGKLHALDKDSGELVWKKDFKNEFGSRTQVWGHAAHILPYKDSIICLAGGTEGHGVISFSAKTGEKQWGALDLKQVGYCPPIIIERSGAEEAVIWSGDGIHGLDPTSGEVKWFIEWKLRFALSVATPRWENDRLFLTAFYNGSMLIDLKPEEPKVVWKTRKVSERDTTHLHSIMSTPYVRDGKVYGVCSYGQLRCLDLESGTRIWETMAATTGGEQERWANVFIMKNGHGDRYLLFNESGDLIDCRMDADGFTELGRMHLIEPNGKDMRRRPIVWSHPAVTDTHIIVRNDDTIICYEFPGGTGSR